MAAKTVTYGDNATITDPNARDTRAGTIPVRHVRVPDALWTPAAAKARDQGETISTVVRQLLRDYLDD